MPRDLEQRIVGLAAVLVVGDHAETHYVNAGNSRLCMLPSTAPSPDPGTQAVHDKFPFSPENYYETQSIRRQWNGGTYFKVLMSTHTAGEILFGGLGIGVGERCYQSCARDRKKNDDSATREV